VLSAKISLHQGLVPSIVFMGKDIILNQDVAIEIEGMIPQHSR